MPMAAGLVVVDLPKRHCAPCSSDIGAGVPIFSPPMSFDRARIHVDRYRGNLSGCQTI